MMERVKKNKEFVDIVSQSEKYLEIKEDITNQSNFGLNSKLHKSISSDIYPNLTINTVNNNIGSVMKENINVDGSNNKNNETNSKTKTKTKTNITLYGAVINVMDYLATGGAIIDKIDKMD